MFKSCRGKSLQQGSYKSLRNRDAQYQWRKLSFRWFIYYWNIVTWRIWDSLGLINCGNVLIPPTINLGGLHCNSGKADHYRCTIDGYRIRTGHDHFRNTWQSCLDVVSCTDNEAYHMVNTGFISPLIAGFASNLLLTGHSDIIPVLIYAFAGKFDYCITYSNILVACSAGYYSIFSAETRLASRHSWYRGCTDRQCNRVSMTHSRILNVKE